jgi:hypothetical protein
MGLRPRVWPAAVLAQPGAADLRGPFFIASSGVLAAIKSRAATMNFAVMPQPQDGSQPFERSKI